jgi:predicted ATPase
MAEEKSKRLRFTKLVLENWRNFHQVNIELPSRVFLIGPNASGKSNLLDALRFLHDLSTVAGGGLQGAVNKRGGVSSLRCLSARRYSDIRIYVTLGTDDESDLWSYEIVFNQDYRQRPILKKEAVKKKGISILNRTADSDKDDPERLTQTHLQQVNMNQQFRDITECFASIKYLHIVPQLIREPDRSVGRRNDPYGGDFIEQVARVNDKTRNARLRRIQEALKVAVPQLSMIEIVRDERGTPHLRGNYVHWRPQGAWQTEELFSDGTLRLMGLLWSLMDGSGPLLLEEPELSLHSDVVRYIPQMFARIQRQTARQILVSSHSADLLRDEGIGFDETFLLFPEKEGTIVRPASSIKEAFKLVEGGLSLAEAVFPHTRPQKAEQLMLFPNMQNP